MVGLPSTPHEQDDDQVIKMLPCCSRYMQYCRRWRANTFPTTVRTITATLVMTTKMICRTQTTRTNGAPLRQSSRVSSRRPHFKSRLIVSLSLLFPADSNKLTMVFYGVSILYKLHYYYFYYHYHCFFFLFSSLPSLPPAPPPKRIHVTRAVIAVIYYLLALGAEYQYYKQCLVLVGALCCFSPFNLQWSFDITLRFFLINGSILLCLVINCVLFFNCILFME